MKRIFSIAVLLGIGICAMAQSLDFLNIGTSVESFGVAGASVARNADAFAADNNAASMAMSEQTMQVAASYGMWSPKVSRMQNLGLGGYYRTGKIAIGLSGRYFMHKPYETISGVGRPSESFTPSDLSIGLGVAYKVVDFLSVGVGARFAQSSIADKMSGAGFGADISMMLDIDAFQAGLSVRNLGPAVKYGETSYPMPMSINLGAAYSVSSATISADVDYLLNAGLMAALGAEYWIADIVAIRAGFHYGNAEKTMPSFASLGLGGKFSGVSLNAAYLIGSEPISNSLMFSLGYSF